jgi:hypothetical protein
MAAAVFVATWPNISTDGNTAEHPRAMMIDRKALRSELVSGEAEVEKEMRHT